MILSIIIIFLNYYLQSLVAFMLRLYKYPGASPDTQDAIKAKIQKLDAFNCDHVEIELCYYIASSSKLGMSITYILSYIII